MQSAVHFRGCALAVANICRPNPLPYIIQTASIKNKLDTATIPDFTNVELPLRVQAESGSDNRACRLNIVEKVPNIEHWKKRAEKMTKNIVEMRGPEEIHDKLIHKQFGLRTLNGGRLNYGHMEAMRQTVNRKLNLKTQFAIWRVGPLWKPVTKKGIGHRMGSGKGNINHYVFPYKTNRVLLEIGGEITWEEVYPLLKILESNMPGKVQAINQQMLEEEEIRMKYIEENNINPFTFQYCVENNMLGCRKWLSPYDYQWFNKYR